jgi:hypothetical protein
MVTRITHFKKPPYVAQIHVCLSFSLFKCQKRGGTPHCQIYQNHIKLVTNVIASSWHPSCFMEFVIYPNSIPSIWNPFSLVKWQFCLVKSPCLPGFIQSCQDTKDTEGQITLMSKKKVEHSVFGIVSLGIPWDGQTAPDVDKPWFPFKPTSEFFTRLLC